MAEPTEPVAPPALTPLSQPPSTDDWANFDPRADEWNLGLKETFHPELTAYGNVAYTNARVSKVHASTATASSNTAVQAAESASDDAEQAAIDAGIAAAATEAMQKLYLGPKNAAPVADNQGNPLQVGALYTNPSAGVKAWYWWDGAAWQLGMGNPAAVDWSAIANKPDVVTRDTSQSISGPKTFTGLVSALMGQKLKLSRPIISAALNTGNTNWITACYFGGGNALKYSRFILYCAQRHYAVEIKFYKTTMYSFAACAEIQVLGAYSYFYAYPMKFRVVDTGANGVSRVDFCFAGTTTATETFEILVLEDFDPQSDRVDADQITYPLTASGAVVGAATPNALTVGAIASGLTIRRAQICANAFYAPVVTDAGSVGQTALESNNTAAG